MNETKLVRGRSPLASLGLFGVTLTLVMSVSAQLPTTLYTLNGSTGDEQGSSVAGAGDVDGDGFEDIVVGRPFDDTSNGTDSGSARVYSGRTGALLYHFDGLAPNDRFGRAVSSAGDFNGDGRADVIIGYAKQQSSTNFAGGVRVYSGADGSLLMARTGILGFGMSVGCADDIDGDGNDDVICGIRHESFGSGMGNSGRAQVFGIGPNLFGDTIITLTAPTIMGQFGYAVDGLRDDIDGDGVPDLIVGQPFYNYLSGEFVVQPGRAYVISGASGALLHTFEGPDLFQSLGGAVAGGEDVDGDGINDVVVGALSSRARVFSGATGALLHDVAAPAVTGFPPPPQPDEALGRDVDLTGDINGDGHSEFLIGIPLDDDAATNAGEARLYCGATGDLVCTVFGDGSGDQLGAAVGSADVDGDGRREMLIGAPLDDFGAPFTLVNAGTVRVISCESLGAAMPSIQNGPVVANVGDLDGDGVDDFAVGTPRANVFSLTGRVIVYSGRTQNTLLQINGMQPFDDFGAAVDGIGDITGDGVPDIAIGIPGWDSATIDDVGRVQIHSGVNGAVVQTQTTSSGFAPTGNRLGASVAGCGDVDGDGTPDYIAGVPSYNRLIGVGGLLTIAHDAGAAYVYSGMTGQIIRSYLGSVAADRLGEDVAGPGDVDGDGTPDVAFGLPGSDAGVTNGGRFEVRSGVSSVVIHTINGTQIGERLGTSVDGAGDVDADGVPDIVSGAPLYDGFLATSGGRARVVSGSTGATIYSFTGGAGDQLGTVVAGAGDVDGDGHADIALGAPEASVLSATSAGRAFIRSGIDGSIIASFAGDTSGDRVGASLVGLGDVDGDCFDDVLVGVDVAEQGISTPGAVYLISFGGFVGLERFGVGTPGCDGPLCLTGNAPPSVGNQVFALRCRFAPANASGMGFVLPAAAKIQNGADLFGFGLVFHVDVQAFAPLATFGMASDVTGFAETPLQIPNIPALAGFQVVAQVIWNWGPTCPLPAFGWSSTNGLELTVQP